MDRLHVALVLLTIGVLGFFSPIIIPAWEGMSIGLGVSHRDTEVKVGLDGIYSFEIARIYNTGDENYDMNVKWVGTGGTLLNRVLVYPLPDSRTTRPDESFLVIAKVLTFSDEGTLEGYFEVVPVVHEVADYAAGGAVVPGAELPFSITVTNEVPRSSSWPFDVIQTISLVPFVAGGLLVLDDSVRRR